MPGPVDPPPETRSAADFVRRAPRLLVLRARPDLQGRAPSSVASPCVRVCCLDDQDMCLGCGRLLAEIRDWHQLGDAEREAVLARSLARLALS